MCRPNTTGCSHNAGATTYRSANPSESSVKSSGQQLLTGLSVRQNNNPASSSIRVEQLQTVSKTQNSAMDDKQISSVDSSSDSSMNSHRDVEVNQNEIDGRSYLLIHQSR